MTVSLADLIAQKSALERKIYEAQSAAKADAISTVKRLMTEYGLTAADLAAAPRTKLGARSGSKVAPKYRDPASGATWTGRGLKPKWLASALADGKSLAEFAI